MTRFYILVMIYIWNIYESYVSGIEILIQCKNVHTDNTVWTHTDLLKLFHDHFPLIYIFWIFVWSFLGCDVYCFVIHESRYESAVTFRASCTWKPLFKVCIWALKRHYTLKDHWRRCRLKMRVFLLYLYFWLCKKDNIIRYTRVQLFEHLIFNFET